jgi:hypothetical protein
MRRRLAAGEHRALVRLDDDDLKVRLLLSQVAPRAGDGAARADAGDEDVDLALVKGEAVERVRELERWKERAQEWLD